MGVQFGDIAPLIRAIIAELKAVRRNTNTSPCCIATTSASGSTSIPEGFASVSIVQTSTTGTTDITMSDGSVFSLQTQGEVFTDVAGDGKKLPAYPISGTATWKWHAIK